MVNGEERALSEGQVLDRFRTKKPGGTTNHAPFFFNEDGTRVTYVVSSRRTRSVGEAGTRVFVNGAPAGTAYEGMVAAPLLRGERVAYIAKTLDAPSAAASGNARPGAPPSPDRSAPRSEGPRPDEVHIYIDGTARAYEDAKLLRMTPSGEHLAYAAVLEERSEERGMTSIWSSSLGRGSKFFTSAVVIGD